MTLTTAEFGYFVDLVDVNKVGCKQWLWIGASVVYFPANKANYYRNNYHNGYNDEMKTQMIVLKLHALNYTL